MDQSPDTTTDNTQPPPAQEDAPDSSASDNEEMPPLEAINEELNAPPHGKNIKGVAAEGDSEDEGPEENKDGWIDVLNNGDLRKKVIRPGLEPNRPPRGAKVTIRLVTRVYEGAKEGTPEEPTGPTITDETFDRFSLILGDNDLYQGLDLLLPLMDCGECARLLIRPRFAYGPSGNKAVGIPEDAMLDLEVEILEVLKYDDSPLAGNPLAGPAEPEPGEPNPIVEHEPIQERIRFGNYKKSRGNFWFERGEYSLAIQCYRGAIKFLDASEEELALADHAKKGKLAESSSDVEEKLREIEDLIDKRAQTYNNLAAAQLKLQAYDQALRAVEDSLLLRPENVKALYRRAKIRNEKGDLDEAIADLEAAIKLDPTSEAIAQELDRLKKVMARQLNNQRQMYRRMMQVKDDEPSAAASASTSKDGDSKKASSSAKSKDSKKDDKSKSKKSWLPFSTTAVLSTVGAVTAAVLIPSLYCYLK